MSAAADQQISSYDQLSISPRKDVLADFERDIEDAIFETIEEAKIGQEREHRPLFGHGDNGARSRNARKTAYAHVASPRGSNQNDPDHHLSVFSKSPSVKKQRKSQFFLALSISAFALALIFPLSWLISNDNSPASIQPDQTIITGTVGPIVEQPASAAQAEGKNEVIILGEPNASKSVNGHVVRIDRGASAGSIIYVNPN